jgi:hypothetical protein
MGIAVSIVIAAVGLILALAVHPTHPGSVDVNTVGWILFLVGLIGFVLDLVLWSQWGPGYMRRRTTYVDRGVAPAQPVATRRRVVEDVIEDGPGY